MIYEYDLAIPANTLATAPARQECVLTAGIVHRLEVTWPDGCNGLVRVYVCRGLHQVWPSNASGRLTGNGRTLSIPVWYELEDAPYVLTVYGDSPGATYAHTITVAFGVQRREVLIPPSPEAGILSRLSDLIFGRGR